MKNTLLNLSALAVVSTLTACGGGGGGPAIQAKSQTLVFTTAPSLALGGTATVSARASSGLAVSYSSSTPSLCSVNTSTGLVSSLVAGTCVIAADQSGNDEFAPATSTSQNLVVQASPVQSIRFGAAPTLALYGSATVSATATSGLAVSYSSSTPAVCTVNSSTGVVTSLAAGDCTLTASQPGNASVNAAPPVSQTLSVAGSAAAASVPGAPTAVSATLGTVANTVQVSFSGPAASGGSPISQYSVSSVPAGLSASGAASPLTVSCPSTCAGYSFVVQASNSVGGGALSAAAPVLTAYKVTARWFEPDTQPNDSIFTGTFTLNSTSQTVTGLSGSLTESMTGPPMTTVPLVYQLSALSDGAGGVKVTSFALNTTNVFAEGGFAANSQGLYYGYPAAKNPAAGGVGNAYATIYVNLATPTAPLTQAQINQLAYGDCFAGGMMGGTCMTGYSGIGTMGGYPVAQSISRLP
ncbi:hypothetical protein [Rhodoferax sp.]|uniref:hypothetical protein n=1 Tax=Rhodoferax sp. TaxID=50421 RepID=UPI002631BDC1|nr:hypothetical protein [Rhodoferax sp.]MDD2810965.1 hypothetical protein [Rhodoferax sp.]MDD4942406.1 hypothetical protein [Rhodoferax sp.]MDD5479568.1 hypothetical protein [Rhodoferax sp.]